ncbi:DUF3622 domain-containing protein [Shewanella maritima]|uniref:DUF3622 domain-containing protein n=1 Tax=Shewanella maritima TaxID=2520507 RepID=UPI003736BF77
MKQSKKYGVRVSQENDGWKAEITRKMTATKTVVSKSQDGFATEAEANQWGEQTLQGFMSTQKERNDRKAAKQAKAKSVADAIAAEASVDEADDFEDDLDDEELG